MGQLYRYWLCQPEVKAYSGSMDGVDLVDQICRFYYVRQYLCLSCFLLDIAIGNVLF